MGKISMIENPKVKTFTDGVAFLISAIFSPYVLAAVFIVLASYKYAANMGQFLPWVVIFLFFATILPGLYILWLLEAGKITDIHMADRNERKWPFLLSGFSAIFGAILLYFFHAAHTVVAIAATYATIASILAVITLYWKISVHTAMFTAIVTISLIIFGSVYAWYFLILIPLVWSRVHRHRHTILQTIAGSMLAFVITAAVFWSFGFF